MWKRFDNNQVEWKVSTYIEPHKTFYGVVVFLKYTHLWTSYHPFLSSQLSSVLRHWKTKQVLTCVQLQQELHLPTPAGLDQPANRPFLPKSLPPEPVSWKMSNLIVRQHNILYYLKPTTDIKKRRNKNQSNGKMRAFGCIPEIGPRTSEIQDSGRALALV